MTQDIKTEETRTFAAPIVTDAGQFSDVTLGSAGNNKADDTMYWE